MGEEEKKKRVGVESLGWLTESTIMPKKHKSIEGVGVSSILELKAELYKSQEESKKSKELSGTDVEYHRAKKKITPIDPFSRKNSGVDSRAHQDKLALKAVSDGSASYAALEKKAELYDKLVRGELSDEEYEEKYSVDFFRKAHMENEQKEPQNNISAADEVTENKNTEDDSFIPFNLKPAGLGRTSGSVDLDEHKRFISYLWSRLFSINKETWVCTDSLMSFMALDKVGFGGTKERKILWKCACFAIIWVIWIKRNGRIFKRRTRDAPLLWDKVLFLASLWSKAAGVFQDLAITQRMRNDWQFVLDS